MTALAVVLLGTLAVLSAPFVRAVADGRQGEHSTNSVRVPSRTTPPVISPTATAPTITPPVTTPAMTPSTTEPLVTSPPATVPQVMTPPATVPPASQPPTQPSTQGTRPHGGAASPPSSGKVIYLTFDDGPSATWTPQILAVLAAYHAHATFFELGIEVQRQPSLPPTVLAAGHRIGNHTYDHKRLPGLSDAGVRSEIARGPKALCLRPPYGEVNKRVRTFAAQAGQRIQLWNVDTRDWSRPGAPAITKAILDGARNGAIILMHDGGGDRSQTVAALKAALPTLVAAGYTFQSLPGC